MRVSTSVVSTLLLAAASGVVQAASSWSFDDASITVSTKGASEKVQEKLNAQSPLGQPIVLGSNAVAKIVLTAKDSGKAKRPHQAFLLLADVDSGLETPFPLAVKDSGKAVVQISQKDIPIQLRDAAKPLRASLVIASFGSATGYASPVFDLDLHVDPDAPAASDASSSETTSVRYGKRPEIHHIFRPAERLPPVVISAFFALLVAATLPALFAGWLFLGANANHLSKALAAAPLSHATFFGSLIAIEGVFFLYYTRWDLFQTLPVAGVVGVVAVLSGTKALGEVQARRLAGER